MQTDARSSLGSLLHFYQTTGRVFYARSVLTNSVLRDVREYCGKHCSRMRTTMLERSGHVWQASAYAEEGGCEKNSVFVLDTF